LNSQVFRLLLVLIIQCIIIAAVFWPRYALEPERAVRSLTQLAGESILEINVSDGQGNEATLQRSGEHWLLPALGGMQADTAMVNRLLSIATEQAARWPVANTDSASQRFAVAQDLFARRINFLAEGGAAASVLLGTSPGFRQVHARNLAHPEIYSAAFNIFEAPTLSADWLAPGILQVRAPLRIVADSYSVSFAGGIWRSGSGGIPAERELQALLNTLRNMQIKGIASTAQADSLTTAEPEFAFSVQSLGGEMELAFYKLEQEYFVRSSTFPYFFGSNAYDFDRLAGIDFSLISGTP
jgi:hypothetical protein